MKAIINLSFLISLALNLVTYSGTALADDAVDRADRAALAFADRSPKTPFDEALVQSALEPGNSSIKSVLLDCYGRGIGCIKGSQAVPNVTLRLYPYTPYLQEIIEMENKLRNDIKKDPRAANIKFVYDHRLNNYAKIVTTDQYGRYTFQNLKPGKYYLISDIVVGHKAVVGHYYDESGVNYTRQEDATADLEFRKVVEITQPSEVLKFESKLTVLQVTGGPPDYRNMRY